MTTNQDLAFDQDEFMDDYSRGLDMLRLASRAFSVAAAGIGYPVGNVNIPTAQVSVNLDLDRIQFEINPHFIHEMKDSEIAAVIAHEAYHVLLGHLGEMADRITFPKQKVLIDAQECIINDGLPGNVGFITPAGTFRGMERHNQDFSIFSTQEGYDFILNKLKEEEEDKADSDSDDGEGQDSSSDSDDNSNSSGGSGSSDGDDNEQSEDGEGGGSAGDQDSSCGGPRITGEAADGMTDEELAEAVKKVLGKAADEAIEEMNSQGIDATPELEDMFEEMKDSGVEVTVTPNYGNPNAKDSYTAVTHLTGMNMNWVELLSIINPKFKDTGRRKYKDSWHAPRRRMMNSYPDVILPSSRLTENPNSKRGDSIPTFIIALDMSGSIPTRLLGDLASLAQSIPDRLIRAFPITWSDNFRIFDPAKPNLICGRGGTRLQSVSDYAEQVRKEEGVEPYVLVITDGGFYMPNGLDKAKMKSKWYWMAIQDHDVRTITGATQGYTESSNIFKLKDFV